MEIMGNSLENSFKELEDLLEEQDKTIKDLEDEKLRIKESIKTKREQLKKLSFRNSYLNKKQLKAMNFIVGKMLVDNFIKNHEKSDTVKHVSKLDLIKKIENLLQEKNIIKKVV